MPRKSSPALYELIRHRAGDRVSPATNVSTEGNFKPFATAGDWLRPGRSVQMPVGYLLVAVALTIAVVIGAYAVGFKRGETAGRIIHEDELGLIYGQRDDAPLRDPLLASPTTGRAADPARAASPDRAAATPPDPARWGPIDSDPRQSERSYFILAETSVSGATRLAEFCREHGLETYIVPGNNVRLRRVIALPGFEADQLAGREVREMRELIHRIGRAWQGEQLGPWNYHEAYLSRYRGS